MLKKRENAIALFKCVTALFLVMMFYKATTNMILSKEKESTQEEPCSDVIDATQEKVISESHKIIGINMKNIKGPSYSLYFLAIFLGLAWNVKKVIKIGIC